MGVSSYNDWLKEQPVDIVNSFKVNKTIVKKEDEESDDKEEESDEEKVEKDKKKKIKADKTFIEDKKDSKYMNPNDEEFEEADESLKNYLEAKAAYYIDKHQLNESLVSKLLNIYNSCTSSTEGKLKVQLYLNSI